MKETWVGSLGREDPLEKEMATHSSILAWKIPWTEKNAHEKAHWIGYSPWGHKRVGQDLMTKQQQIYIHADTHTPSIYTYICVRVQSLSCVQLFAIPWTVSLPGSSVHGIFQARILECLPFSPPGDLPNPELEPAYPALAVDALLLLLLSHFSRVRLCATP